MSNDLDQRTRVASDIAHIFNGRYRLEDSLSLTPAEGAILATQQESGRRVVIRIVPIAQMPLATCARIQHEASLLESITSSSFSNVIECVTDRRQLYHVSDFVPGIALDQRLAEGPLSLADTLFVGRQLLEAVAQIHQLGILHRDIRPRHVIIEGAAPLRSATLVSAGFVAAGLHQSADDDSLESAAYASPEIVGALDVDVAAPADLYSVGMVMFECLAGANPLTKYSSSFQLEQLTATVPELRSSGVAAPRALEELIQRLLRMDPRDRYQSAQAALDDLRRIEESMSSGSADPAIVVGTSDRRDTFVEPAFVARRREIDALDSILRDGKHGRSALVVLEAKSGGGKSRLLDEITQRASRRGSRVFRGNGSPEVRYRPYELWTNLIEQCIESVLVDACFAAQLRAGIGVHRTAFGAAFPRLSAALGWHVQQHAVPEEFGEARTVEALAHFLQALGSEDHPALILLDDCHWADELTLRLVVRWWQLVAAKRCHAVLLVAFDSEEVAEGELLRQLDPTLQLKLAEFSRGDMRGLVESMTGSVPTQVIELVHQLSEGNPFAVTSVLRGLAESNTLVRRNDRWHLEPPAPDFVSASGSESLLARRIELLPPATAGLLRVGAILGKEFDLQIAADLASQPTSHAVAALEEARRRNLIRIQPNAASCVFVHDQVRDALVDSLKASEEQSIHLAAAEHLRQHRPAQVFDLAYQFDQAGQSELALPFAIEAAAQARSKHSLDVALRHYEIARRGAEESDDSMRFQIEEGLGDVFMLRGDYPSARHHFAKAVSLAGSDRERSSIAGKLGDLCFQRGEVEAGVRWLEHALMLLGTRVRRHSFQLGVAFLRETTTQILHSAIPSLFLRCVKQRADERDQLAWRTYNRLAGGYRSNRRGTYSVWAHLRGMNLAECYPPTQELAEAYAEHGRAMTRFGLFQRGIRYAHRSLQIRTSREDVWGQGQSLSILATLLYHSGRYGECLEKAHEAIRLLQQAGDYRELHLAQYHVAASLYRLGELEAAAEVAKTNHESAMRLGDTHASTVIFEIWSRATLGRTPADAASHAIASRNPLTATQVCLAEGIRLIDAHQVDQAVEQFARGAKLACQPGAQNAYGLSNHVWLATAIRMQIEDDGLLPRRRRMLMRAARQAVRRALATAKYLTNDLPHALREAAILSAIGGSSRKAMHLFQRSLDVAERQGMQYEYAQTRHWQIKVGTELGWGFTREDRLDAESQLRMMEYAATGVDRAGGRGPQPENLSLVDRYARLLEGGRRIAAALSRNEIFEHVHDVSVSLLHAERCFIVPHGAGPSNNTDEGSPEYDCDRVDLAVSSGRAVAFEAGSAPAKSATPSSDRSTLCAPIFARGQLEACLYVTHRDARGFYGSNELQLADFISSLAGAAIENADGFLQLRRLNQTLEQRVAERTAAAEARAQQLAHSNEVLESTQRQLWKAKDAAEAANNAKSQFLATVSHEIRTPMNGILGMTDLTLATKVSPQQRSYLVTVKQSANLLLRLINDILDLSKIEAGRMELEIIEFDVRQVIGDATKLPAQHAAQQGIDLLYRVATDVPEFLAGDPGRVHQVLINLVGNAVKFTSEGHVLVDVDCRQVSGKRTRLQIRVEDTGIGIPTDKQDVIFESFQQADNSTTRRFGGTGLGLSISSQLVRLMGGQLWVESTMGAGSTFHLEMEFDDVAEPDEPSLPHHGEVLSQRPVILIDEHPLARQIHRDILQYFGLEVSACDLAGWPEAVAIGQPRPELVVFSTYGLGKAEEEIIRAIRSDVRLQFTPILVLIPAEEGSANSELPDSFKELEVLPKPTKYSEMRVALFTLLFSQPTKPTSPSRLKLLLAEDGQVNQEVAIGLLEMQGHQVRVANNGREAVEAATAEYFDAILMDLDMPEMDGFEATRAIREWESRQHRESVPILAMTAHAYRDIEERCREAGFNGHLTKPIQPTVLFEAIGRFACQPSVTN